MLVAGTRVGAYAILSPLGEGGMGAVYLAEHTMLGRRAAIKVLHPAYSNQPEIVTRFFNEARAATAIPDPGIVQIFDFGHHIDGSAYIVMELLEGETLAARLATHHRLAVSDALRIMRQVASSLGAAHARGIVHRDLKPENIFLVRDREVAGGERAKILDFGIAKLVGDPSLKTVTSVVMGTPIYMSPEQCRGAGHVDQRSDIYSLGCVLFALVVGLPPFLAEGSGELIAMHLREPAPRASTRHNGVPPAVDELLARCLEKDPALRYTSGSELADALGEALARTSSAVIPRAPSASVSPGQPVSVVAPTVASTTLSSAAGMTNPPTSPQPVQRASATKIAGAALVVLLGGAGTYAVIRSRSSSKTPAVSAAPGAAPGAATIAAVTPQAPAATAPAAPPDPTAAVAAQMKDVLGRFVTWSKAHAGAPCPDVAALGGPVADTWGHPIVLTCTEQPGDQIIGALSSGPDGASGTSDDIASWQLGRDVTALVHGTRWVVAAQPVVKKSTPPTASKVVTPTKNSGSSASGIADPFGDSPAAADKSKKKPAVILDENGLPVTR